MGCGQGQMSTGVTGGLQHVSTEVNVVTGMITAPSGHCQQTNKLQDGRRKNALTGAQGKVFLCVQDKTT